MSSDVDCERVFVSLCRYVRLCCARDAPDSCPVCAMQKLGQCYFYYMCSWKVFFLSFDDVFIFSMQIMSKY